MIDRRTLCGILSFLVLSGCGYSLVGKGSNLPPDIARVYVAPLENETGRSQVDQILTDAITQEMVTRRRYEVVNSAAESDAVLSGAVVGFSVRPVGFDVDGLANNLEVTVTADVKFQRSEYFGEPDGEVLWANSRYVFREAYPIEDDGAAYFDREISAITETSDEFARTLVSDLLEGF